LDFEYFLGFSEGFTAVQTMATSPGFGYVDTSGAMVIAAQYDGARAFSEGLAMVYVGGRCGYIDRTGTMVIAAQYLGVNDFSGGLAEVRVTGNESGPSYIDKTGKMIWQGK
jgi:hypothetical protein